MYKFETEEYGDRQHGATPELLSNVVLTCVCTSSDAATPSPLHTPLLPPRTTASTFAADDG